MATPYGLAPLHLRTNPKPMIWKHAGGHRWFCSRKGMLLIGRGDTPTGALHDWTVLVRIACGTGEIKGARP